MTRLRPGSFMPRSARNSFLSSSARSAICASMAALIATTGAPSFAAYALTLLEQLAPSPSRPRWRRTSWASWSAGTAAAAPRAPPWTDPRCAPGVRRRAPSAPCSSAATRRTASFSPVVCATLANLEICFSTASRSASASSVLIVSMSETGSTLPATWITFGSSKQRTTCAMASVSRMLARNLLPRPSPFDAPATSPAMSTNSTIAGTTFSGFSIAGEGIEARIGHLDDADVRLDGAERIVLRRDAGLGERVEQGGLADVGQADDAALQLFLAEQRLHAGPSSSAP